MSPDEPWVLGISASHNGAACLLKGDRIVCAIQEERLHRQKRQIVAGALPSLCVEYCLQAGGIGIADVDLIAFNSLRPMTVKRQNILENPQLGIREYDLKYRRYSHHRCHAASAFALSGFETSDILVVDGQGSHCADLPPEEQAVMGGNSGEWECLSFFHGAGPTLRPLFKQGSSGDHGRGLVKQYYPSLGETYRIMAEAIFGERDVPGKLMGLAPHGKPALPAALFFKYENDRVLFPGAFIDHLTDRHWPRNAETHMNHAASIQTALEETVLAFLKTRKDASASPRLCYAGGVALNSVLNERIIRESGYDDVFILPCAEDNGNAIGAAYLGLWDLTGHNTRQILRMDSLGKRYSSPEITDAVQKVPASIAVTTTDSAPALAAGYLAQGGCGGWFQGGAEFGPRALGHRSIIADPRRPDIKNHINLKVKKREWFRPFAPSVLLEQADDWFEMNGSDDNSPFMLRVVRVRKDKQHLVPGIVHVDGTARIQTVTPQNGAYHDLIQQFHALTGVPMVLNTSLNVMGEPIAETPEDAIWCLLGMPLEFLVLEDRVLVKRDDFSFGGLVPRLQPFCVRGPDGEDAASVAGLRADANLGITSQTPWGPKTHTVIKHVFQQSLWIDGTRTNQDIVAQINAQTSSSVTLDWWKTHVRVMARTGMVTFLGCDAAR